MSNTILSENTISNIKESIDRLSIIISSLEDILLGEQTISGASLKLNMTHGTLINNIHTQFSNYIKYLPLDEQSIETIIKNIESPSHYMLRCVFGIKSALIQFPPYEEDDFYNSYLGVLSGREKEIICYRFGLKGQKKLTLDEISAIYFVTRERIRQIEQRAINKLRQYGAFKLLYPNIPEYAGLDTTFSELLLKKDISVRTYHTMVRSGFSTIRDIKDLPEDSILAIRNLGKRTMEEINFILKKYTEEI